MAMKFGEKGEENDSKDPVHGCGRTREDGPAGI
jgi:hypothetical protein